MAVKRFTGTYTALVTPLKNGAVAFDELKNLVEKQIAGGISGLVPVGTTGESPTLDHDEHLEVIRAVVETSAGRVPVLAGTGSNSTAEAVSLTKRAHEAGVDGFLQVAPYYNKPSQEGLFRHFSAVADATNRPIMLYSIPGRCVIEIGVATVARLRSRYANVNHIKEAGGSCDRVDQLRGALGDDLVILSGDDSMTLPFMALGAQGVVSVASNLMPMEVGQLVSSALAGDFPAAGKMHRRLLPLFKGLFAETSPAPIKFALAEVGIISSAEVRLPLCEMTAAGKEGLSRVIAAVRSS